jgi:hypothetical protein
MELAWGEPNIKPELLLGGKFAKVQNKKWYQNEHQTPERTIP